MRFYGYGNWDSPGFVFSFPWGGIIMIILVLALIALLTVIVIRLSKNKREDLQDIRNRGIDILIERYAKGEIDAETFRKMKADITGGT